MLEALRKEFIPTFSAMSLLDDSLLTQTPGRHRKNNRKDHNSQMYKNTTLTEVKNYSSPSPEYNFCVLVGCSH